MSRIGNIYLIWRKGQGSRRIPIGIIRYSSSNGITFNYLTEGVEKAKKEGFKLYTGFPDLEKTYTENVLSIFGQRIPKIERNDLNDFYTFWKVDQSKKKDIYYMLSQTQGILPTDNFEFLTNFNSSKNLKFISEISGLSSRQISSDSLNVGDTLSYKLEPTNPFDKKAVLLYIRDIELGYMKLIHSKVFYKTNFIPKIKVHHIERNGVLKRVFISVEFL